MCRKYKDLDIKRFKDLNLRRKFILCLSLYKFYDYRTLNLMKEHLHILYAHIRTRANHKILKITI